MFGKKWCNSGISGFLHAFFVVFLLLLFRRPVCRRGTYPGLHLDREDQSCSATGPRWCGGPMFLECHGSTNRGTTKSSHFNRVFHYKPSILGYHYFWKHLGGGFKYFFIFTPNLGEIIQFDGCIFFRWVVQPPTRRWWRLLYSCCQWCVNCLAHYMWHQLIFFWLVVFSQMVGIPKVIIQWNWRTSIYNSMTWSNTSKNCSMSMDVF